MEESEAETMDQPTTNDSHVEGFIINEYGEEFSFFQSLVIVQKPSIEDTTFHFQTEGQPSAPDWMFNHSLDDIVEAEFCPTTPFWETSLGHSISEYGTTQPSYVTPI